MYKVKPFERFDLSDVKLPDTMYRMAPIYDQSFVAASRTDGGGNQTGGDQRGMANNHASLEVQTERMNNLSLSTGSSSSAAHQIDIILHLAYTSPLLDYLVNLKADLKDQLTVRIYRHSSLSNQALDDQLIKRWYSLSGSTSAQASTIQIILQSSDLSNACLFKSDSNLKLTGEIKILALLNGLFPSSMSVQVHNLSGLVGKLLLDEYLAYLQQSLNTGQVDKEKIKFYQSNLQIKSKVLELAELIYTKRSKPN